MKGQQILVEMKILFFILVCLLRFVLEMIRRYHTAEKKSVTLKVFSFILLLTQSYIVI